MMTAESKRLFLLAQHDSLRQHTETCVRLAKLFGCGEAFGADLDRALEMLREEFAVHNAAETRVISELLRGPAAWGSLMIDRMLEEHLAEHAAFWELLSGTRAEIAARIADLADELEAHMAAEERTFLAPATLRDDVIGVRTREDNL
jgi:iron-sulfur cluster repair protein YtfE (RIC family)